MASPGLLCAIQRFALLVFLLPASTSLVAQSAASAPGSDEWQGYPPLANDAAPGASAPAIAAAKALGRGVNFGNIFDSPREGDWGPRFSQDLVDKASAAGFTSVRLPVRWSNHASASAPYAIDPVFMERVVGAVDALLARNFNVVLNMHHYRQLDGDPLDANEYGVASDVVDLRFLVMWEQIARSTSITTASWVASSTTTKAFSTRPSDDRSKTKSIDQTWFATVGRSNG